MRRPLLTIQEVSDRLSCTERHVRNLTKRGTLSFAKLGGSLRFDPEILESEIEALTVTSQTLAPAKRHKPAR